jgi:hypothetical protein
MNRRRKGEMKRFISAILRLRVGGVKRDAVQREGGMWLRRKAGKVEMKPDFTQYLSVLNAEKYLTA